MKRILRILMIAICCMVSCNMVANAGNDKPIPVNALPAKAQTLLSNHFNNQKVMLATIESGIVPSQLIPQPIKNYLKDNYAGQSVKKIEMNKNEYEVELANGLDLTFNKHFQLIDID